MTDTILKGQMEIHQAFWPKGFPGALNDTPYSYDPDKAKKILADAGIKTPITATLDVINSSPFTDMAQALQASFAKGGIDFKIVPGTGSQVITKYRARTHEAMLLYWGPDFMDPDSNASAFAYNADNSDGHYQSTTTWRNAWAVPDDMNKATVARPRRSRSGQARCDVYRPAEEGAGEFADRRHVPGRQAGCHRQERLGLCQRRAAGLRLLPSGQKD